MKKFKSLIRQILVLALICMGIAVTMFTIADLPPFAKRNLASLSCFSAVASAPGPEAPISAPPSPPPGQASTAARAHSFKESVR